MKGKKNLEKAIVMGLLLSTSVYGTAWAEEIPSNWNPEVVDNKLIINNATNTVRSDYTYNGKGFGEFDTVEIFYTPNKSNRPLGVYSARYDLENTDIIIHYVNGETSGDGNNDALHLSNHYPHFNIRSFTADVTTESSDGINLSHDITSDDGSLEASVVIGNNNEPIGVNGNGDLTLTIADGSGIRANASAIAENVTNSIIVKGKTDITINGNSSSLSVYHPTAVYAGGDSYYDSAHKEGEEIILVELFGYKKTAINTSVKGKGIIDLQGQTNLQLNGRGNYGIWSGKNGKITVNDLKILSVGSSSYGVAATNGNITWGGHFLGKDDSVNKFGSSVTMNGDINYINMEGNSSFAIYADGVDVNGSGNTVKSGDNGIGNLTAVGDIVADNGGKIDLDIRDWADITGNIEATNSATVDLGIKENTVGISLMSNTPKAINITGNIQAANGATINLAIGDNAKLTGRIDDYKDADNKESWANLGHDSLFDEDFAKEVDSSGKVNLTLGNNSEWFVTEQSWATSVKTAEGAQSTIDLTKGQNSNYAVHIGDLDGSATFVVNLDPNIENAVNNGSMIYVYDGTGANDLNLRIANETEVLSGLQNGEKLRFATVASAGHGFGDEYIVRDRGVINSGFRIEYENYDENATEENNKYNGGEFSENKPGNDYITDLYKDGENVYIVRDTSKDAGLSDAGKTIINMSRANYKNAIYMDRLNKRLGKARYINGGEDQGMWVRLRHDRIGQSGDFRSMNTMYELGYDVKQDCDNGERRIGMAVDYMRGSTSYSDIAGKGETKRYGLWLYDTWLGDKGHYVDYVAKWGHLDNEFDIYTMTGGEKVNGDYSNNVFSVSAEYGKKNDMGNNWYFEPQAQLQLARVTGADYVSSQNTKVSVDGINSLIGRAGFRLGHDFNENSTVFVKADLLHEFLGDQTITATDATGTFRDTFKNKGTWYDIGFGFATALSNSSYAFMDFEKSFGNDNDETYQINAGVQWTF